MKTKRLLAWALVVAMLFSSVAMVLPANARSGRTRTDDVEAFLFTAPPTIDGYISEAEWESEQSAFPLPMPPLWRAGPP